MDRATRAARATCGSGASVTGTTMTASPPSMPPRNPSSSETPGPRCWRRSTTRADASRATSGSRASGCVTWSRPAATAPRSGRRASAARTGGGVRRSWAWRCTRPGTSRAPTRRSTPRCGTCPHPSGAAGTISRRCSRTSCGIATNGSAAMTARHSSLAGGGSPPRSSRERATTAASHAPEGYAPAYADTFQQLEDQAAMFRRGDSCLVVAAYDLSDDALFGHQAAQAALVVARDEHSRWVAQHPARSDGPDVLTLSASCDAQLLSLEIVAPGARRVARVRHGIGAGGTSGSGPAGLDVLLFDAPDSLPGELSAVLSHVLGTTRVRADRKLGLFWELYGVTSPAGPVSASLAVTPLGVGWLRRTVEALGLASHTATMRLHWDEGPATRAGDVAVASRALAVDLSALSPGRYRIELTVKAPGQEPATASREIEVVRP